MADIEKIIFDETDSRLKEMESSSYEFPSEIRNIDWILIVIMIIVSLIFIVLCQVGVII